MSNVSVDIAEAIKFELAATTFSESITFERVYVTENAAADLDTYHGFVMPRSWATAQASRTEFFEDYGFDIVIQKHMATQDASERDAHMAVVDEVYQYCKRLALPSFPDAKWMSVGVSTPWMPDLLREHGVMSSQITILYRVKR